MFFKLLKNDLRNSKLISMAIFIFILFSATLLSTSAILATNLLGSIDQLMKEAKTPHYLQMHMGPLNKEAINEFAQDKPQVIAHQILSFLNIDSSLIHINGKVFPNTSQDNGFSYQSEKFDFLLDLNNNPIQVREGQVYVPLLYYLEGQIKKGDTIEIGQEKFIVEGPLRDSQMNTSLSSSKRFLIHRKDFQKIHPLGREEFLIEFLLKDKNATSTFQKDYINASLPANGPAITYSLFRLINSINDGILISIFLLLSLLSLLVCFLSIRLTLLAKMEEDYQEIGVLKAIGMRLRQIKKIYYAKYLVIAFLALSFGYGISLILSNSLLTGIEIAMGPSPYANLAYLVSLLASIFLFFFIFAYIGLVLKAFKKISPAQAIRFGIKEELAKPSKGFTLREQKFLPIGMYLGIKNVLSRKKLHGSFFLILIISGFILLLPKSLSSTLSDDSFIPYIGIGNSDILMTLQEGKTLKEDSQKILQTLNEDPRIKNYSYFQRKSYEILLDNKEIGRMQTELGNHTLFPVKYLQGRPPKNENEIALSQLQGEELGKTMGDALSLKVEDKWRKFTICGLYSDITNGGKTSKATFQDPSSPSLTSSFALDIKEGYDIKPILKDYMDSFPTSRTADIGEFRDSVFGSTLESVHKVSLASLILACGLTFFIGLLFTKMLIIKDRKAIAILKACGFPSHQIKVSYFTGSIFLCLISYLFSLLLAKTLGANLASSLLSMFGVSDLILIFDPLYAYLITPLILFLFTFLSTKLASGSINEMKISDSIKE